MPTSIHSDMIEEVYDIPLEVIHRPLQTQLDEKKVLSIMETLKVSYNFTSEKEQLYKNI